jgi:hypothetical protein
LAWCPKQRSHAFVRFSQVLSRNFAQEEYVQSECPNPVNCKYPIGAPQMTKIGGTDFVRPPFCRTADRIDPAECVDHIIVLGEMHLRRVLKSYADYTHRSLTRMRRFLARFSDPV